MTASMLLPHYHYHYHYHCHCHYLNKSLSILPVNLLNQFNLHVEIMHVHGMMEKLNEMKDNKRSLTSARSLP